MCHAQRWYGTGWRRDCSSSWLSHKRPANPVRRSVMGRPYLERVGCVSLVGLNAKSGLIWRVLSHRRMRDGSRAIYATSTVRRGRPSRVFRDARSWLKSAALFFTRAAGWLAVGRGRRSDCVSVQPRGSAGTEHRHVLTSKYPLAGLPANTFGPPSEHGPFALSAWSIAALPTQERRGCRAEWAGSSLTP